MLSFLPGLTFYAHSQKMVQENLDPKGKKVEMKFNFADSIVIKAWDKNTIELQVSVNIDENRCNDYYNLKVNDKDGNLQLVEDVNFREIQKKKGDNCNYNSDIVYKLNVPANLEFSLNTISGMIELKGLQGKMTIHSISGFIDYTVPLTCKARIDLSTVTGNVYSNLKVDEKPTNQISWVGTKRKLTLNGGNQDVALKTVSGDIYLRKGR